MQNKEIKLPSWLISIFENNYPNYFTKEDVFLKAESIYGSLSFHEKECLNDYLLDLADKGIIIIKGNFIYKKTELKI